MSSLEQPLVSVVIPCYNHENFVQDCIQSVINQTYENIELIIIDDGSKDGSVEKIQEMLEKCYSRFSRFEFITRSNRGLSETLNEAINWCKGKYFSAIASDDILIKDKISSQLEYLENESNLVAVFGRVLFIDQDGKDIEEEPSKKINLVKFEDLFLQKIILMAPTQLIRLENIKKVGGYIEDMIIEDWYMWLKLSKIGKIKIIDKVLVKYRYHENNTVTKFDLMQKGRFEVISKFKNEKLYKEALANLYFNNEIENVKFNNGNVFLALCKIIFNTRFYFFKILFFKLFLKLKGFLNMGYN